MTTLQPGTRARSSLFYRSFSGRTSALFLTAAALLVFATPEPGWLGYQGWLWVGLGVAGIGSALRAWASGYLEKNVEIARCGPYRLVRHPLYLGSLILWSGLLVMAGNLWIAVPALAAFCYYHLRAIRLEERTLIQRFGEPYEQFRRDVPALFPTRTLLQIPRALGDGGFSLARAKKNREWHVPLGIALMTLLCWTFVQMNDSVAWRGWVAAGVAVSLAARMALYAAMDRDIQNPFGLWLISLLSRRDRNGRR